MKVEVMLFGIELIAGNETMKKDIEEIIKKEKIFCDICGGEIKEFGIKIFPELIDYGSWNYEPNDTFETFDICTTCILKKVFPFIEKEFGIKSCYRR